MLAPAQYWHDPFNPASYVSKGDVTTRDSKETLQKEFQPLSARFLPLVNNARPVKSASVRDGIARLKLFVMIMWRNDTMIKPKESSHFQFYRPGQVHMFSGVNISLDHSDLQLDGPICLIT